MKKLPRPLWLVLVSFGLAIVSAVPAAAPLSTWPQWRGPLRDGQVTGTAWPDSLDTNHLRKIWRIELGPSYSGPIVGSDRVFTTESKDKKFEVVTALDRSTGRELWRSQWEGAMTVPFFAKSNGDWIRSTPALDGDRLYVAGMRDVLVCLDTGSGTQKWRLDFVKALATPPPDFGFVCSPLVDGDSVYVQAGAAVARIDKFTGKILWRALEDTGGMMGSAFSSPVIASLGGRRQLVVQTREKLAGLDLADGRVLWSQPIEAMRGMNILTPLPFGEGIFTSAYGGKTHFFRIASQDGEWKVNSAWTDKVQGYMSTPVVVNGHAYQHAKNQRLRCVDLQNGTEKWMTGEGFGKYWSLVANGDRILGLDQRGQLFLLRADVEKFSLLSQRKISKSETWAHLAVAGNELYIRELDGLSAWRWEKSDREK
jgi:outer membrane protein assembly factor BamB